MPVQPIAEYFYPETFIFVEGPVFITHSAADKSTHVKMYKCPNTHIQTFVFHSFSKSQDMHVQMNSAEGVVKIQLKPTGEERVHIFEDWAALSALAAESAISIRNTSCSEETCTPTVHIHGQKTFSINEPGITALYHSPEDMKLYTYMPLTQTIKEYALFNVEKISPSGLCFLYPTHMVVHVLGKKYTLPIEYTPDSLISLFHKNRALTHVISTGDLIAHKNEFKRYPDGFRPTSLWNTHHYIYMFSRHTKDMLVLNQDLSIEHDMGASSVFVSSEYVFVTKNNSTVAHHVASFSFAFLLPGYVVTESVIAMEVVGNLLLVFSAEKLLKETTPLFSLFLTEINIETKSVRKRTACILESISACGVKIFGLTECLDSPCITTGLLDVSFVKKGEMYMAFGVSANSVFVFYPDGMAVIPVPHIISPFAAASKEKSSKAGAPVRIDPSTGTLYIVKDALKEECIFPSLVLLAAARKMPPSVVFALFFGTPEYKTSVEKTLFHFLNSEEIELAIDLIECIKEYANDIYEEVVSVMLRLLDERNVSKLYSLVGRNSVREFRCAESLSRALVRDLSLFERFLESAIAQNKEHLVAEFVEFASKIDDPPLHLRILSLLLEHTMLYAAGLLLSGIDLGKLEEGKEISALLCAHAEAGATFAWAKDTQEPAEVLEKVFLSGDPVLIAMVAEKLCILNQKQKM
ncbi:uncharacterized protein NEMAJ01_0321 [Nematocida major]|uniref:uncharacterized protein n=1 Tax=Nematocida major TaxID=1912982 RepID=UPI002007FCB9|nr:uncharacterized protein NEMAJ01_0321 [Nematocida major]KAH9385425.1 hypothetical protein NEMAJ01_0321 [Nematocida major]